MSLLHHERQRQPPARRNSKCNRTVEWNGVAVTVAHNAVAHATCCCWLALVASAAAAVAVVTLVAVASALLLTGRLVGGECLVAAPSPDASVVAVNVDIVVAAQLICPPSPKKTSSPLGLVRRHHRRFSWPLVAPLVYPATGPKWLQQQQQVGSTTTESQPDTKDNSSNQGKAQAQRPTFSLVECPRPQKSSSLALLLTCCCCSLASLVAMVAPPPELKRWPKQRQFRDSTRRDGYNRDKSRGNRAA